LDSGASRHMTKAHELCSSMTEEDSGIHVELGDDTKYAINGEGNIFFHLKSSGSFNVQDVLYVLGFRKTFLSILVMEEWGFFITFRKGKVLMHLDGASRDIAMVIGVREGNLYRLACKLV